MARTTFETLKVFRMAASPAAPTAPTEAELTAATDLSPEIPVDGVEFGGTANNASQAMLGDAFVAEEPGTFGSSLQITFMADPEGEALTLFDYRTEHWMVFVLDGEGVDGDPCYVYHVKAHKPIPMASAENEYQKVQVQFAVLDEPVIDGVVAAS